MARAFRGEDRGKDVVDEDGTTVGTISLVEDDHAEMDATPDLTGALRDFLGWGDDDESGRLERDHIDEIGEDKVRLRNVRG
jgi:hypothetical protein